MSGYPDLDSVGQGMSMSMSMSLSTVDFCLGAFTYTNGLLDAGRVFFRGNMNLVFDLCLGIS